MSDEFRGAPPACPSHVYRKYLAEDSLEQCLNCGIIREKPKEQPPTLTPYGGATGCDHTCTGCCCRWKPCCQCWNRGTYFYWLGTTSGNYPCYCSCHRWTTTSPPWYITGTTNTCGTDTILGITNLTINGAGSAPPTNLHLGLHSI